MHRAKTFMQRGARRKVHVGLQCIKAEETMQIEGLPFPGRADTFISDYVWLPLRFEGNRVIIEWKAEDYE